MSRYSLPDTFASNAEKTAFDYGLKFARYIDDNHTTFRDAELIENESYATGYQSADKIKRLLLNERNESYGKLSFEQPIIIPKFIKTVKKNLNLELFETNVKAIDSTSMNMREKDRDKLTSNMINQDLMLGMSQVLGIQFHPEGFTPQTPEDRDVYMDIEHQLPQEVAMEEAVFVVKEANRHDLILDTLANDIITYGKCVVVDDYDPELGVRVKRINPLYYTTSYDGSEMKDNRDAFYNGHYELISLNDLHRIYGLSKADAVLFAQQSTKQEHITKLENKGRWDDIADSMVEVLFFEFKTTFTDVYSERIKENNGKLSVKEQDEDYEFERDNVHTIKNIREAWMEGVWILDSDVVLDYRVRNNQVIDSLKKVRSKYSSFDTNEMSLVRKMIPHANAMSLAMIKMNQMIASARPKGLGINISSLLDIPQGADGSGEVMSYLTLIEMFNDTGNQLFRQDEFSAGQGLPIVELENGLPRDFNRYVEMYNHNLQQLNIISGVNEQMSGMGATTRVSTESNQIALQSSIKSIEYVKDSVMSCEKTLSENIILRVQDIDEYDKPFRKYVQALGIFNVMALMELKKLHPFTYSIAITMKPSIEERQQLKEDMTVALNAGQINIADKIEVEAIKNVKLATMVLKRKIKINAEQAQARALEIEKAKQQAAMAKMQSDLQVIQAKGQADAMVANVKGEWDYKIALLKVGSEQQANQMKTNASMAQAGAQHNQKQQLTEYQQEQMNRRQSEKLDAMERQKVNSDVERNIGGRVQ